MVNALFAQQKMMPSRIDWTHLVSELPCSWLVYQWGFCQVSEQECYHPSGSQVFHPTVTSFYSLLGLVFHQWNHHLCLYEASQPIRCHVPEYLRKNKTLFAGS